MVLVLLAVGFGGDCLALAAVDLVSWRRTASLRRRRRRPSIRGRRRAVDPPPRPSTWPRGWPRGSVRSSAATFLAAVAGALALSWGLVAVAARHLTAIGVVLWGAFVAAAGLRARVTGLDVQGAGLRVHYAAKPSFFVSWDSLRALHPPRTAVGAWRLDSLCGAVRLMPSDLMGHERLLEAIVCLGALAFDGRTWVRGRAPP